MATLILRMKGNTEEFGYIRVTKVMQDNPRIAFILGRPVEAIRINETNLHTIQQLYTFYEDILRR